MEDCFRKFRLLAATHRAVWFHVPEAPRKSPTSIPTKRATKRTAVRPDTAPLLRPTRVRMRATGFLLRTAQALAWTQSEMRHAKAECGRRACPSKRHPMPRVCRDV